MSAINGRNTIGLAFWPGGGSPSATLFTLNQTTDQIEFIFQADDAITITKLGFRYGTRTGTPPTYIISLQGVDTSGNPDGTIKGGGSPASVTFTPPADTTWNNTWKWQTLANSYTCARGEMLAVVIAYSSGTVDASNCSSFTSTFTLNPNLGQPYAIKNDAGSRTRESVGPIFGYASVGQAYGCPVNTAAATAFNSGSTPDEKALLLTIPTTWWSTYKIAGATLYYTSAATTTFDLVLYDTDGTSVLQNVTYDTDADSNSTAFRSRQVLFDEATLSTLNAGATYRLAFVPAGTSLNLASMTVAAAGDLEAWWGGSIATSSSRTDAGAWTDDATTRYGINPIVADITAPAGGGASGGRRNKLGVFRINRAPENLFGAHRFEQGPKLFRVAG